MKKLLAIAVAAALVAPAAAMAETTLYGKLHASVGEVKTTTGGVTTKDRGVESHSSRLGVKGSHSLNNGLEATYGLEFGLDLDGDNGGGTTSSALGTAKSTNLSTRNTFVGVKGGFGEVRVGKHDTPAKLATAGQDVFADGYGDMSHLITADSIRAENAVAYINKFGPVGFAAAATSSLAKDNTGLSATGCTATDLTLTAGNCTTVTGTGGVGDDGSSAYTAMLNYGNGPWYAGLGYTKVKNGMKDTNLGLGWKSEVGHQANLIYEKVSNVNTDGSSDKNLLVNGVAKLGGAVGLKAQYGEGKRSGAANGKQKLASIGLDYSLGKKTSVYLLHSQDKNPTRAAVDTKKVKATAVGLVTEF